MPPTSSAYPTFSSFIKITVSAVRTHRRSRKVERKYKEINVMHKHILSDVGAVHFVFILIFKCLESRPSFDVVVVADWKRVRRFDYVKLKSTAVDWNARIINNILRSYAACVMYKVLCWKCTASTAVLDRCDANFRNIQQMQNVMRTHTHTHTRLSIEILSNA